MKPRRRQPFSLTREHGRDDRVHREDARGKGKQQAETEKAGKKQGKPAAGHEPVDDR
ncbi:hypothetical protein [Ensifer sp. SSB1]|uniref:hypothetical protein n=1 Tax=Ensifer sp. SSB1 TaxID=2795385 RepID=UPI001A4E25E5|nr:hypothetical protein [Ensifer sp. SSB1]MBK5569006.1 hypothetical protein [Ensifer sp. SSB1]